MALGIYPAGSGWRQVRMRINAGDKDDWNRAGRRFCRQTSRGEEGDRGSSVFDALDLDMYTVADLAPGPEPGR
jgi:hypothetical protein